MSDSDENHHHAAPQQQHIAFFGVYDGHGGEKAAIFTGEKLHHLIKETKEFKQKDYINALKQGFLNCDQEILKDFYMRDDDSGCAATSAIITPDLIVCGNAGDSRTIMSTNGFAKALSFDHKPSNEGEKARICAAGGYVDMGRVNGNLALSRGIGDFDFKKNVDLPAEEQIVTCYPDVIQHNIDYKSDEFVVLACDGIWDCLTSQKCVECVRRGIYERKLLSIICEEIMDLCCAPTSDGSGIGCDNMSIAIVALLDYTKNETLDQWYEKSYPELNNSNNRKTIQIVCTNMVQFLNLIMNYTKKCMVNIMILVNKVKVEMVDQILAVVMVVVVVVVQVVVVVVVALVLMAILYLEEVDTMMKKMMMKKKY